jgi:hypothetical protein
MGEFYLYAFLNGAIPAIGNEEWQLSDYKIPFQPFYVGKGTDRRLYEHFAPSNLIRETPFYRKLRKLMRENHFDDTQHIVKLYENLTEEEAWKKEEELIEYWGRKTKKNEGWGLLYNTARGGSGGDTLTDANRVHAKEAHRKRMQIVVNDSYRKKCSDVHLVLWRNRDPSETAAHISSIKKQVLSRSYKVLESQLGKNIDKVVYCSPFGSFSMLIEMKNEMEKRVGYLSKSALRSWFYDANNHLIAPTRIRRHVSTKGRELQVQEHNPTWNKYPFLHQYEGKTFYQAGFFIEVYYKDQSSEALHGELLGRLQ